MNNSATKKLKYILKRAFFFINLLILITIPATVCIAQLSGNDYSVSFLTTKDGLSQGSNGFLLQDSKGYMWISSQDGINRYNGKDFFHFNDQRFYENCKPFKQVYGIIEDQDKNIWVGTRQDLYMYSQNSNTFRQFNVFGSKAEGNKVCMPFASAKDEVWETDCNLSFKAINIKTYSVRTLFKKPDSLQVTQSVRIVPQVDEKENIWTVDNNFIYKINIIQKTIQQFLIFADESKNATPIEITSISLNLPKQVLGISTNRGLVLFNTITQQFIQVNDPEKKVTNTITWNIKADDDFFYISSLNYGLLAVDVNGSQVTPLLDKKVLNNEMHQGTNTICMYKDKWKRLWLCADGEYIAVIDFDHSFIKKVIRDKANGLIAGTVNSIAITGDKVWVCDTYLSVINKLTGHVEITFSPSLLPGNVTAFHQLFYDSLEQRIWIAASGKLYYYDLHSEKFIKTGFEFPGNYPTMDIVRSFVKLDSESLLMATRIGVYKLDKDGKKGILIEQLTDAGINHLTALSQNRLALSVIGKPLKIFKLVNGRNVELIQSIALENFPMMVAEDSGRGIMWAATEHGVYKVDNTSFKILRSYTTANGMANDFIYAVLPDQYGWIWCSTNRGIVAINTANDVVRNFDITQNLQDLEFNNRSFAIDKEGYIYFGGVKGINYFKPPYTDNDTIAPSLIFEEINLNNKLLVAGINPDNLKKIEYPYGTASLSVKVEALHLKKATSLKIIYRLKNEQEDWTEISNGGYIQMFNLAAGNYTLEISYREGNEKEVFAKRLLAINVLPPWYNTWWFYSITIIIATIIAWVIVQSYIRSKLRKEKEELQQQLLIEQERMRISADLHDEVGGSFSAINLMSEMLQQKGMNDAGQLARISASSKELVQKMNEIVWALNAQNDTLQNLIAYIRHYAVQALTDVNISCKTHMPDELPDINFPGEKRRSVFLLVKECINNIIKHSNANAVEIIINTNHALHISIHDNGKGFSTNDIKTNSFGITNIQKRINELHGSIEWKNNPGTTVIINLPLYNI